MRLDCGCCGMGFKVWSGYVDQDQDNGYGICKDCQVCQDKDNEEYYDHAMVTLYNGMNDEHKIKWDGFDRVTKKALVNKAFSDKLLGWRIS